MQGSPAREILWRRGINAVRDVDGAQRQELTRRDPWDDHYERPETHRRDKPKGQHAKRRGLSRPR